MVPKYIIVHCTDSNWGTIEDVDQWHKERGFVRTDKDAKGAKLQHVGYHRVITNGKLTSKSAYDIRKDGVVFSGRELDEVGAHCLGMNDKSIGICLVGKTKFTELQQVALVNELAMMCLRFGIPSRNVLGHCETKSGQEQGKTCPNLSMNPIRAKLMMRGL